MFIFKYFCNSNDEDEHLLVNYKFNREPVQLQGFISHLRGPYASQNEMVA